jgi:hypothetical protein
VTIVELLRGFAAADEREEADRCAMLRLAEELQRPLSRDEPSAHFTASAFVVDETCTRVCLVEHAKLGRLLQPGGHIEPSDETIEAAALREAHGRRRSRSSSIPTRSVRSTSTSTGFPSVPASPSTFTSMCATC